MTTASNPPASAQHIANQTARYTADIKRAGECWTELTMSADPIDAAGAALSMTGIEFAESAIEEAQTMAEVQKAAHMVGRFDAVILGHVQGWQTPSK